ncbi:MAG: PQQ-binding-like beta-propeller repeat protein [Phycisphaeraceae bacterium]
MSTLAVITLPVLAPIAALLQLLFPGLLAEQWRHYKIVISVLITQSTVFMLHWAAVTWWVTDRVWWLSDVALTLAMITVAAVGLVIALRLAVKKRSHSPPSQGGAGGGSHSHLPSTPASPILPPHDPLITLISEITADPTFLRRRIAPSKVEYFALGIFAALGVIWFVYQLLAAGVPLDPVAPITVACLLGIAHLLYRRSRAREHHPDRVVLFSPESASASEVTATPAVKTTHESSHDPLLRSPSAPPCRDGAPRPAPRPFLSTELVLLLSLTFTGAVMAVYLNQSPPENRDAGAVTYDWPTYRGNKHRTGAADTAPGPRVPAILWTFDPAERKGRVMIHSSPTVVGDRVFVGALHQVLTTTQGYVYCVDAGGSAPAAKPGSLIWRFSAEGTAKAIFTSPSVLDGKLYVGEGYHEDTKCRLFCVDARTGKTEWALPTTSHTESAPTIIASRVYFGAGDDGVYCVDGKNLKLVNAQVPPEPTVIWHHKSLHVDTAPAVADGRVFISTVIGDEHADLKILALDADTGDILWQRDTPLPVPGSPSHDAGRVYFGLGNGKLGAPSDKPQGAVWCVDAKTGDRLWEFKTAAGVFNSPALHSGLVVFGSLDKNVYCLDAVTGDLKWKTNVGDAVVAAPVVTEDAVYIVSEHGLIKCIGLAKGDLRWAMDDLKTGEADAYASPTLAGGRLYVAIGGKVHCIGDR